MTLDHYEGSARVTISFLVHVTPCGIWYIVTCDITLHGSLLGLAAYIAGSELKISASSEYIHHCTSRKEFGRKIKRLLGEASMHHGNWARWSDVQARKLNTQDLQV